MRKKLAIITDAWEPQINGVVTTLKKTVEYLQRNHNFEVIVIQPYLWETKPFWAYSHIDIPKKNRPHTASKARSDLS